MKQPTVATGVFIFNEKGELLLVKSYKWGNHWVVPGGRVEVGEKIEETVRREIKEEVNLRISRIKLIQILEEIFPKEFFKKVHFVFFNYICRADKPEKLKLDGRELQEFCWVKPKEALSLNLNSPTRKTLLKILSSKSLDNPLLR